MTLREEFSEMLGNCNNVYIFGTGDVADRLYELVKAYDSNDSRVQAFVVSEARYCKQDKPKNVLLVDDNLDFNIPFLVTVNRVYHPEVFELLEKIGANIIEAHKFYMLEIAAVDSVKSGHTVSNEEDYKGILKKEEFNCRNKLLDLYSKNCQAFGKSKFYQSFPRIKLEGERPTDIRIEKYGLLKYLSKKVDVLDIGANDGFIDMEIASQVNSVLGIEYNEKFVELSCTARDMLKIDNVEFICDDYNHWKTVNQKKFDIIFSFAIHVWIGTRPEEYANDICNMLNDNGVFFFESHQLESDVKYVDYCREFERVGLEKIREDSIIDDGKTNRRFAIFIK